MKMPKSQTFLLLLLSLCFGFNLIVPILTRGAWLGEDVYATGGQNSTNDNAVYGCAFEASTNGNITAIAAYCNKRSGGTSQNVSFAVYSYSSPTNAVNLLGSTYETKITSTSILLYTCTMKSTLAITDGTRYFLLAYFGNSSGGAQCNFKGTSASSYGIYKNSAGTYPTFPATLSGESTSNNRYSIYAIYTESGAGIPTIPSSSVDAITPYWHKAAKTITATGTDGADATYPTISGGNVKNESLWYRYSTDNASWGGYKNFGLDTAKPWSWSFTFTNGSGYYQFYTIATDVDGNVESAPGSADRYCAYDGVLPTSSVDALDYTQTSTPLTINVTAADTGGSGLKEVSLWYRTSSDNITWGSYALVSSDTSFPWSWSFALTKKTYYQFYSIAQDNVTNSETGYTMTMGNTATGSTFSASTNTLALGWFTAPASFLLTSLKGYTKLITGTSVNLSFGVYQWVSNTDAGNLLGSTYETKITSTTAAWYTLNLKTPMNIVSGTKYYFGYYVGNYTGAGPVIQLCYSDLANGGVYKTTGLVYPTFPSPLASETPISRSYSVYTNYYLYDQTIYADIRVWTNVSTSGYNTFGNASSWVTSEGWNMFTNTALWRDLLHYRLDIDLDGIPKTDDDEDNLTSHFGETGAPGWITADLVEDGEIDALDTSFYMSHSAYYDGKWNTFGNISAWDDIDQGWNTFGNSPSWQGPDGWNTFGNQATYNTIDSGWNTFGNTTSWTQTDDGWNTFGNTPAWQGPSGWNTFGNALYWTTLDIGWNTFGNLSGWKDAQAGWNTFGNNNYTAFLDWYPQDNDTVDPTSFTFMAQVEDTNGTLMNITWEYYDGANWVFFGSNVTSGGNNTYYKVPSPWFDLYNHTYRYRVTATGTTIEVRDVTFTTIASPSTGVIISDGMFGCLILLTIFGTFLPVGYAVRRRSAGMYLTMAGIVFIGIIAFLPFNVIMLALMLCFSGYITMLGIKKMFFSKL